MNELTIRLTQIPNAYYEFIDSVRAYAAQNASRLDAVMHFLNEHPDASTSDVLHFIMLQPDFFEDEAPVGERAG